MSENSRVAKAAGVVGAATLTSRILGFIRDAVIAWFLGAGFSSDAFIAAFRIPNLLRRLFAEGSLSSAFIPVFTEYIVKQGQAEAFHLARSAFRLLGGVLIIAAICGVLLSPWIARLIAPGFSADKLSLTITLMRLMFPYILFIGMVALCMGILNVLGHFAAPAFAPVLLNLSIIGSVFFISPSLTPPVIGLAVGVLIGGFLQLALQLPVLIKMGFHFWREAKMIHPGLKRVGTLIRAAILGGAVYQINIIVGTLLGSLLIQGSVTYLYFADRLVQFPLGVLAVATATAVLPSLSRQAATGDLDTLKDTFGQALKLVFFVTIPATVGLIILREPIVALLFQRGEFDAQATRLTAQALLYYSMGLCIFGYENSCGHLFCPSGYPNPCKNGGHIYICQYRPGSCADETACPRWTCSGHITCLDVESGASPGRFENQTGFPGMEKHRTVCLQIVVMFRGHGGCRLLGGIVYDSG